MREPSKTAVQPAIGSRWSRSDRAKVAVGFSPRSAAVAWPRRGATLEKTAPQFMRRYATRLIPALHRGLKPTATVAPSLRAAVALPRELCEDCGRKRRDQQTHNDMDFIHDLIAFVARIWIADSQLRDQSMLGSGEFDKQGRRFVAKLCGGIILLLLIISLALWWFCR